MARDHASRSGLSPKQQDSPMYFPPPPSSTTDSAKAKRDLKFNFGKPRSSPESSLPKPILKKNITSTKRTRQWILLFLLILSFTVLILSVIFAYCAAMPHSDNVQAATASSPTPVTTTATYSVISIPAATQTPSTSSTNDHTRSVLARNVLKSTSRTPRSTSTEDALAEDQANQAKFSTSPAKAALTFYTATLPLLTIFHTSTELLTSLIRPETSQATLIGTALRFTTTPSAESTITRRRIGTLLSFTASVLLTLGWSITQIFWINCEIAPFKTSSSDAVCPVQIRGHSMGGVSELSVGKIVLAFVILLGYAGYCTYLVSKVGVFSRRATAAAAGRVSGFRRRARFASGGSDDDSSTLKKGDVECVVVEVDPEKD